MCPDRQILSLFFDGELPSPWKDRLETHLASCRGCAARLEEYRRLSRILDGRADTVLPAAEDRAKDRVWRRLAAGETAGPGPDIFPGRFWTRRVSLPLPAAAAAAAVLVIVFIAVLRGQPSGPGPVQDSLAGAGIDIEVGGITPATDMNGVLQYLGDTDSADIVIIRLPESKRFTSSGEPAILRAADYSRNGSRSPEGAGIPGRPLQQ